MLKAVESVKGLEAGGSIGTVHCVVPRRPSVNPCWNYLYLPSTWNNAVAGEGSVKWRRRQSSVVTEDVQEPVKAFFLLRVLQSIIVTEIVREQWNDSLCRRLGFFWCTFSSDLH